MKIGLQAHLLMSHLLVMTVGLVSFVVISNAASQHFFVGHLQELEYAGLILRSTRLVVFQGFATAWRSSSLLALAVGTLTAAGLSYWLTRRITRPLTQMERIAHQFTIGNFDTPVPNSEIPELARLGRSFNRMASSLENVELRRRALIGELTHELRTPLTVIRGYLEALATQQMELDVEIYELLLRETKRLERLVNDLQELSKAEAGHLTLNLTAVEIQPLFQTLIQRFAQQIMEDEVELVLDCATSLPTVLADPDRLEQILVNLMGNAIQHTPQGAITLKAWSEKAQVWIAVIDTGTGIATEDLPHVFERFWRSAEDRQSQRKGTGIGLAITKRLVELQGGKIGVESHWGQGSTFFFFLPST